LKILILTLLMCTTCAAQGITPTARTFGRGGGDSSQPRVDGGFGLPARTFDGNRVSWRRIEATASAPALLGDTEKVFLFGGYSYMGLSDQEKLLPPRLVKYSAGAFGIVNIDQMRLTLGLTAVYQGDGDAVLWDNFDIAFTAALNIPIDSEWSITPGLRISTGVNGPGNIFRYIPLPSISATWKPSEDFSLTVGLGDFSLRWRQSRWLTLEAAYFPLYNGQVRVSHEVTDWLTIREFIGRYSEGYVLTGNRWPENHGIYLNTWSTGVTFEFGVDLSSAERPPRIGVALTYALGFGGKIRTWDYNRADELFEMKLQASHNFLAGVYVRF
jgi:hypothetical protein